MYRKRDREQIRLEEFEPPFGGKLDANNRWVKKAALMPSYSIGDIATMVGYNNAFYFSRAFKQQTGYPPSIYKKNRLL